MMKAYKTGIYNKIQKDKKEKLSKKGKVE